MHHEANNSPPWFLHAANPQPRKPFAMWSSPPAFSLGMRIHTLLAVRSVRFTSTDAPLVFCTLTGWALHSTASVNPREPGEERSWYQAGIVVPLRHCGCNPDTREDGPDHQPLGTVVVTPSGIVVVTPSCIVDPRPSASSARARSAPTYSGYSFYARYLRPLQLFDFIFIFFWFKRS